MKIFEQTQIGSMKLRNRTYMAPIGTSSDPDGAFSDRSIRYYEERAKGGFGLIITGANQVTTKYEAKACNILGSPKSFEQLNFLARRVHNQGAKLCLQLTPGLGRMQFTTGDVRPYSCSENASFWFPEVKCKEFTVEDIKFLVQKMGEGAGIAQSMGADAVELHGYGGYLMDQFHSTLWNWRSDEYGGNLENRLRFSIECIEAVRAAVGPDFPILFKFTPYHGVSGGRELDEGIAMAKILEKAGVDALHVDTGSYEAWYKAINTVYQPHGVMVELAGEVKKNVNVPVMLNGKLNDPAEAEAALVGGKADYVGWAHMAICEPHFINKLRHHETYDIIPCIGCNECLYAGFTGKTLLCAVNPLTFAEDYYPVLPGDPRKRILVIGGGPAGMMAAITSAERGMQVELWEKRNELGGLLISAGGPSFKKDVKDYLEYLVCKVMRSRVKILMMKDAVPEEILAGKYDKVIFATGAIPIMPALKGIGEPLVVRADDLLANRKAYGKKVVIIGGGLVGCEAACHCAEKADEVTILEMLPEILLNTRHSKNNDQALRQLLEDNKVNIVTNAEVLEFKKNEVIYEKEGKKMTISADTAAIAVGYRSNTALYEAVNSKIDCAIVGDAEVPDKILTAVHRGFNAARCI